MKNKTLKTILSSAFAVTTVAVVATPAIISTSIEGDKDISVNLDASSANNVSLSANQPVTANEELSLKSCPSQILIDQNQVLETGQRISQIPLVPIISNNDPLTTYTFNYSFKIYSSDVSGNQGAEITNDNYIEIKNNYFVTGTKYADFLSLGGKVYLIKLTTEAFSSINPTSSIATCENNIMVYLKQGRAQSYTATNSDSSNIDLTYKGADKEIILSDLIDISLKYQDASEVQLTSDQFNNCSFELVNSNQLPVSLLRQETSNAPILVVGTKDLKVGAHDFQIKVTPNKYLFGSSVDVTATALNFTINVDYAQDLQDVKIYSKQLEQSLIDSTLNLKRDVEYKYEITIDYNGGLNNINFNNLSLS